MRNPPTSHNDSLVGVEGDVVGREARNPPMSCDDSLVVVEGVIVGGNPTNESQ